jgi:NAD(P)H-hydrate epimerase
MFTAWGKELCGAIRFDDLQVPTRVYDAVPTSVERWNEGQLEDIQPRPRNAHKGQNGHALMIGGDHGMSGAIRMAGEAALRCGVGLCSIATRESHAPLIAQARPELMCHGTETTEEIDTLLACASVIAIGPGLGENDWGRVLFQHVLNSTLAKVVDADALKLLATSGIRRNDWILTPHPGEAARLLNCEVMDIENDRFAACEALHSQYGGVCVLKGSGTIIYDGQQTVICDRGNPGMASGGSGDVLTGITAAMMAQFPDVSLFDIAQLSVGVHAVAADRAAQRGERGLIASDIIRRLRSVVNRV